MEFKNAIRSGFNNYSNFKGRANRAEFWYWVLFFWIAVAIGAILDVVLLPEVASSSNTGLGQIFLPINLVGLALFIPNISVFVRRLHDTDHKGWWWLVSFVPFGSLAILIWLCTKGTPDSNNFGEPNHWTEQDES